jgi:hypothetical protein
MCAEESAFDQEKLLFTNINMLSHRMCLSLVSIALIYLWKTYVDNRSSHILAGADPREMWVVAGMWRSFGAAHD